jgi:hypothetical protein
MPRPVNKSVDARGIPEYAWEADPPVKRKDYQKPYMNETHLPANHKNLSHY